MFALGVIHEVLAEDHLVVALDLHQLGEVAEFGVAQLGPGLVGGLDAVAAAARPHGAHAVVLAAGGEDDLLGADGADLAVQDAEHGGAGDAVAVGDQVGHDGLVHEADALLLGGAADLQRHVQVHPDHGGPRAGGHDHELAVHLGQVGAPLQQLIQHIGVHGDVFLHELLVGEPGADVLGMEGDEILGIDLFQVEILEHAAAAVGLARVTGEVLLHHQHVGVGIVLLDGGRAAQAADAAADDQDVTAQFVPFTHLVHLTCKRQSAGADARLHSRGRP